MKIKTKFPENVEPFTILNYWLNTVKIIYDYQKKDHLSDALLSQRNSPTHESSGILSTAYNMITGGTGTRTKTSTTTTTTTTKKND